MDAKSRQNPAQTSKQPTAIADPIWSDMTRYLYVIKCTKGDGCAMGKAAYLDHPFSAGRK